MSLSNNTNPKVLLPTDEQSIKTEYIVAGVLLAIIGFFGFFLNLLVIVVIIKDARNLWTPVNVVLLNMVVGFFFIVNKKFDFTSLPRINLYYICSCFQSVFFDQKFVQKKKNVYCDSTDNLYSFMCRYEKSYHQHIAY